MPSHYSEYIHDRVQTDHPDYVRDLDSKALLSTNLKALHSHRSKKQHEENMINTLMSQDIKIKKLERDLEEMKTLLLKQLGDN